MLCAACKGIHVHMSFSSSANTARKKVCPHNVEMTQKSDYLESELTDPARGASVDDVAEGLE